MTAVDAGSPNAAGTFRSLRHKNARIFFVGLLVSNIGTWLQFTGTSYLVYQLTGRATDLGINTLFQFMPMLLLGAWAGGFADRHDRRTVALYTQSGLALQAFVLAIAALTDNVSLPIVYGTSLFMGIVNAIDNPSRRGLVTELVEPHEIGNAMSLNTTVMTGSRIFGPALAAMLIGPLGAGWLFMLNALSFFGIIGSLLLIDKSTMFTVPPVPRSKHPVRDGLSFVMAHPTLKRTFIVFAIVSTFAFNYSVVLPKLTDVKWGYPGAFGWMLTVISVGSIVGSLATARLAQVTIAWFRWSVLVCGISAIALAWSPNIVVAFIVALPLGASGTALVASMNAISQQDSSPEMRSRLLALVAVAFLGSTPIGGPITGWVADNVGIEWSLAYGGVITLLCLPMLRRVS
jgi:MFS family permease